MSTSELAKRLTALEVEVERLKQSILPAQATPWWHETAGSFANDPIYDEAMRLGRQYRESLRPKAKKAAGRHGSTRHRSR